MKEMKRTNWNSMKKYKTRKSMKKTMKPRKTRKEKPKYKGGGYTVLRSGKKYSFTDDADKDEKLCHENKLNTIFPPFDGDNEIYIWLNDRCENSYNKNPILLFENTGVGEQVKVKRTVLRSIWGHCAFSFDPEGPIWGFGPYLLPVLEHGDYVVKTADDKVIDSDGYITFASYGKFLEFKQYFESISYTGTGISLYGNINDDTQSFKDILRLTGCNVYRFTLFTKENTQQKLEQLGIQLGKQRSYYGIYKDSSVCYGNHEEKDIFNCITYIIDKFKPYFYVQQTVNGKCIFNKTVMDVLGKYCASVGMTIEQLKNTIGAETFNKNTPEKHLPECLRR